MLNQISCFWFDHLKVPNHLITADVKQFCLPEEVDLEPLSGRSMLVRKTEVVPIECVVRGYLVGSGWKDYQKTQAVCGIELPEGLQECSQLPEVIFTPATKEESGHDINISFERMVEIIGQEKATTLRDRSIDLYTRGSEYALTKGIIIADTKFEWGVVDDELILFDEVLTPDSSRFWPADQYVAGKSQPSYDKQFVREWLETTDWDKNSDPPQLPEEIIAKTREKYIQAYEQLTETAFPWK